METSTCSKKIVQLRSSDGQLFEVDEEAAMSSEILKNMIEMGMPSPLPLYEVDATTLAMIVESWNRRLQEKRGEITEAELERWEEEELLKSKEPDGDAICVLLAANYLEDEHLIDRAGEAIAHHIKDMTVEEVRDYFEIENDFEREEEEKVFQQNAWAFH
ncbi:SKP1-like protein 14 [Typha angustifolia]|uniref:SKP1-like protein 14 n=1 Tax=Typha angustifolia TaxID=59011 RepID=UPI003C2EF3D2